MAKGGRPGLGAKGRGSPDPDLAGAAPPRLEEKGPKTLALQEKMLCWFGVRLFDHLAAKGCHRPSNIRPSKLMKSREFSKTT